jgi:hypothetical protein
MPKSLLTEYWDVYNSLRQISPLADSKELRVLPPSDLSNPSTSGASSWSNMGVNTASGNEMRGVSEYSGGSSSWGYNTNGDVGHSRLDSNQHSVSGWGDQSGSAASTQQPQMSTDDGPISFNFDTLNDDESLSESCAVANHFLKTVRDGHMLLIFDVGGSTTDISVLCKMPGPDNITKDAMIKQNSIRWAAQRLSEATRYSKNFQSVLLRMCESKKIRIQGLNNGPSKYNQHTAPLYYEQVVDRLEGNDFQEFYRLIAAECKELMCVNLYVTGLIMYYAGQLTYKLRQEITRSTSAPPQLKNRPMIDIRFAGKGARMFNWFEAVNHKASREYYQQMFMRGVGGLDKAKETFEPIRYPDEIIRINEDGIDKMAEVKYEVSKGLAWPIQRSGMLVQTDKQAIEILGEEGFYVYDTDGQKRYLEYTNSVTPEMMEYLGSLLLFGNPAGTPPCPRFMDFADLFYKVAVNMFGFEMKQQEFIDGFNNMNITSYIKQDPDYIEAQKQRSEKQKFDFITPVFVMEGMKFYEERILKALRS